MLGKSINAIVRSTPSSNPVPEHRVDSLVGAAKRDLYDEARSSVYKIFFKKKKHPCPPCVFPQNITFIFKTLPWSWNGQFNGQYK